ncbi:MAG: hypothetical protein MJY44_00355 [Bacteroidales bacterium]|nr:hypothetical protein [Bacteroidales bacterium]
MFGRVVNKKVVVLAVLLAGVPALAQNGEFGSFHPYSLFGIGDRFLPGTAYNRTMGGVGTATRNNRFINPLNPASVTARDTLSFMCDFSMSENNRYFKEYEGDVKRSSARNTFNLTDLIMSFPIYRSSAMMIGISPYSSTGYSYGYYEDNEEIISQVGNVYYSFLGQGSIYQGYIGAGVTFWKRLSLGAQWIHYFGNISKTRPVVATGSGVVGFTGGTEQILNADGAKFGLQYEQPIGSKWKICLGATYNIGATFRGYVNNYVSLDGSATSGNLSDTTLVLASVKEKVRIAPEATVGISVNYMDKIRGEFNYAISDWRGTGLDTFEGFASEGFQTTTSQAFRVGFEYVPNRNDVRYFFRRCAYRVGAYWEDSYYLYDGRKTVTRGVTLGITLPVFRWYNGLSLGVEFGKNGVLGNIGQRTVDETFVKFAIGINLFDIWFQKLQYD